MDDRTTTVAFVTYRFGTGIRRIGPMPMESAETCAKELTKRDQLFDVRLEEWSCSAIRDIT